MVTRERKWLSAREQSRDGAALAATTSTLLCICFPLTAECFGITKEINDIFIHFGLLRTPAIPFCAVERSKAENCCHFRENRKRWKIYAPRRESTSKKKLKRKKKDAQTHPNEALPLFHLSPHFFPFPFHAQFCTAACRDNLLHRSTAQHRQLSKRCVSKSGSKTKSRNPLPFSRTEDTTLALSAPTSKCKIHTNSHGKSMYQDSK